MAEFKSFSDYYSPDQLVNTAMGLARLKAYQQQLEQDRTLAPKKMELAKRKLELEERRLNLKEKWLPSEMAETAIDVELKRDKLSDELRNDLRAGDLSSAMRKSRLLGGDGSYVARDDTSGIYELFLANSGKSFQLDPFYEEKNNPDAVAKRVNDRKKMEQSLKTLTYKQKKDADASAQKLAIAIGRGSSRNIIGRTQMQLDAADGVAAMLSSHGIVLPDNLETASPQTKEMLIKKWDKLPPQFVVEVVNAMTRMLTQGVPTDSGRHELDPETLGRSVQETIQYITGRPQGVGVGGFILKFAETIQRERDLYRAKQIQAVNRTASGFTGMLYNNEYSKARFIDVMRSYVPDVKGGHKESYLGTKDLLGNPLGQPKNKPVPSLSNELNPDSDSDNNNALDEVDQLDMNFDSQLYDSYEDYLDEEGL